MLHFLLRSQICFSFFSIAVKYTVNNWTSNCMEIIKSKCYIFFMVYLLQDEFIKLLDLINQFCVIRCLDKEVRKLSVVVAAEISNSWGPATHGRPAQSSRFLVSAWSMPSPSYCQHLSIQLVHRHYVTLSLSLSVSPTTTK